MRPRLQTEPLRISPGEARALLHGLRLMRPTVQEPAELDRLAHKLTRTLPDHEREEAARRYLTP